jgi:hypothetical protein
MDLEKQIERVTSKDNMHRIIDNMGDDVEAIMIARVPDPEDDTLAILKYFHFGDITIERSYWLSQSFGVAMMKLADES